MSEEIKLLPCPFCGGTNAKPDKNDEADFDVTCLDCHAGTIGVGPGATGMESAIAAWNTRTPPESSEPSAPEASAPPKADAWEWWSGPDDEFYRCGPFDNRDDAVAVALCDYDDLSHIHVIEAIRGEWPAPSAYQVIESMFENSDDLFSDDYPEPSGTAEEMKSAESELQAALDTWMNKWRAVIFPTPTTFQATRNAEVVPLPTPPVQS